MDKGAQDIQENYYLIRACAVGAKGTGATTFCSHIANETTTKASLAADLAAYKDYHRIAGKLKVKLELSDKPHSVPEVTNGFFRNKTILFILFDLSRPETFQRKGPMP